MPLFSAKPKSSIRSDPGKLMAHILLFAASYASAWVFLTVLGFLENVPEGKVFAWARLPMWIACLGAYVHFANQSNFDLKKYTRYQPIAWGVVFMCVAEVVNLLAVPAIAKNMFICLIFLQSVIFFAIYLAINSQARTDPLAYVRLGLDLLPLIFVSSLGLFVIWSSATMKAIGAQHGTAMAFLVSCALVIDALAIFISIKHARAGQEQFLSFNNLLAAFFAAHFSATILGMNYYQRLDEGYKSWAELLYLICGFLMLAAIYCLSKRHAPRSHHGTKSPFLRHYQLVALALSCGMIAFFAMDWSYLNAFSIAFIGLSNLALFVGLPKSALNHHKKKQSNPPFQEKRYRTDLEYIAEAALILDEDGRIRFATPAAERLLGTDAATIKRTGLADWVLPGDIDHALNQLNAAFNKPGVSVPGRWRVMRTDGTNAMLEGPMTAFRKDAGVAGAIVNVRDVTGQITLENNLRKYAHVDLLTGLATRPLLFERIDLALALAPERNPTVALFSLDIDQLKNINDQFGYAIGDEAIKIIARRLQSCAEENDTVARLGGDEFALLACKVGNYADLERLAERIFKTVRQPMEIGELLLSCQITIGIATADFHDSYSLLLKKSDAVLSRAKQQGGNRWQCFTPDLNPWVANKSEMRVQLRQAIEKKDFALHYQPIMATPSQTLHGLEVLIRWRNDSVRNFPPETIVRTAEESGLICLLGQWVAKQAIQDLDAYRARLKQLNLPPRLIINLSPRELESPTLIPFYEHLLEEHRLASSHVVFEIHESILRTRRSSGEALHRLANKGFGLILDSFGSGCIAFNELTALPFKGVKLANDFIARALTDAHSREILAGVISMAKALNLEVYAKGVEAPQQAQLLSAYGCDSLQGHWLSEALSMQETTEWLAKYRTGNEVIPWSD